MKIFSILEKHIDGSMWYHPDWSFEHEEAAINFLQAKKQQDYWSDRYMEIFIHSQPLPQKSVWTRDGIDFHDISGAVIWNKEKGML